MIRIFKKMSNSDFHKRCFSEGLKVLPECPYSDLIFHQKVEISVSDFLEEAQQTFSAVKQICLFSTLMYIRKFHLV